MILFYTFLVLNLIAFVLMGIDKKRAKNHQSRISEKTLLVSALIGGTIGSGFGMLFFRHKTAKKSFLCRFWLLVLIQLLLGWFYFFKMI